MKITNKNMMQFEPDANDRATIDMAQNLLSEIINHLEATCGNHGGEGILLYNPNTGEFVTEEELMRTKGVLDFFYGKKTLEVQF